MPPTQSPPLLAAEQADDTAAAVLLSQYRDTVEEMVARTRDSGDEQAVSLFGPDRDSLEATGFRSGSSKTVMAVNPPGSPTPPTVIQMHSHPPPAPVSFSVQDVRVFVGSVLDGPRDSGDRSAFAVVGQRGGEVRRGTAYIHTLEPAGSYLSLPRSEQRAVRERVQQVESHPTRRAIQLDGDPNSVLDALAAHVRYDRRRFSTRGSRQN